MGENYRLIAYDVTTGNKVFEWQEQSSSEPRPSIGDRLPDGKILWEIVGIRNVRSSLLHEVDVRFSMTI